MKTRLTDPKERLERLKMLRQFRAILKEMMSNLVTASKIAQKK